MSGSITKVPPEKPTFSPWVFPDSGDFMVCTDGRDGGEVPFFDKLFPAFDYPHADASKHWCVRQELLGGDTVPVVEVISGVGRDLLNNLVVDGQTLHAGDGDNMSHELEAYLAALFAMSPKLQAFIRDKVVFCKDQEVADEAQDLLHELYTSAYGAMRVRH